MFIAIIFIVSAFIIWFDWVAYKRYVRPCADVRIRRGIGISLIVANLLPYIAAAMMWLVETRSMVAMMWLLTIYTILAFSRLALYCGILTFKNSRVKWSVGGTLCTIVATVLIVGVVHTRKNLTVKNVEIVSDRLPQAFDG